MNARAVRKGIVPDGLESTRGIGSTANLHPLIVQLRRDRQLLCSQREMARRVGTSGQNISDWEYGRYSPTLANLTKWADALGYELVLKRKNSE